MSNNDNPNTTLKPETNNDDFDKNEIQVLYNILDQEGTGRVTLDKFIKNVKNPLLYNKEKNTISEKLNNLLLKNYSVDILKELFTRIDINKDNVITIDDFSKYYENTTDQISAGFQKIDLDKDGVIRNKDILKYLDTLEPSTTSSSSRSSGTTQPVNKDDLVVRNEFIKWAFGKEYGFDNKDKSGDIGITYDDFRLFLLFIPKNEGSRLKTAYNHYYYEYFLNKNDLDLSSDSDIIYINNSLKYFLAGGTSGVISRSCTAPLDRIKVFLIANEKNLHIVQVIKQIYLKGGGWKNFYVGNGLNSLKVFPESAIKFGSFELVKKFGFNNNTDNPLVPYICGGIAGVIAQLFVYPIDTIKYRMQCENIRLQPPSPSPLTALHLQKAKDLVSPPSAAVTETMAKPNIVRIVKEVYRINGVKTFYRGLNAGLLGMFPYAAIDLGTFNLMKNFFINKKCLELGVKKEDVHLPTFLLLPMGAFSGSIGATIVYPVNLLRTRLQAQGTFAHPYLYDGFMDCARKTIIREGYRGLFKGLVPNLAKVCPAVSISYVCYENLKKMMNIDLAL